MANSDTVQCRICCGWIDADHPDTIYGVNPLTRRWALMCYWCYQWAYEELDSDKKDQLYEISQG